MNSYPIHYDTSLLTADDLHLFNEGRHFRIYEKLGAHRGARNGASGTHFAVWAPNAVRVSVAGDFNGWSGDSHRLQPRGNSGLWEGFIEGVEAGAIYKYRVDSRLHGYRVLKADPFAFRSEMPPRTGSLVTGFEHQWGDGEWMAGRGERLQRQAPVSIYEVHLGSWRRAPDDGNRSLSYREIAPLLTAYIQELGFTHVELMPVMEHPFFGSWGYQTTGYFAPSSRFGSPDDFAFLIDHLHQHGVGVILDWVPSHFPTDEHGLAFFDGTHLYEHADARRGFHPEWKSAIFNYGRNEVRGFLISSAMFWLDRFHADGLRVDGVASMLYLDYARSRGEWEPNLLGGNENLEAVAFLRELNTEVYRAHPGVQTIAEESTAWPMVSRPVSSGGLGFGFKWDMGWMHDTLKYLEREPAHRSYHHDELTFRMMYAFTENYVLPLSHDEVVYGKGSLLTKMPGDHWQRLANLRLLFAYMYGQPGKKLVFMGGELGEWLEWNHDATLDWGLLNQPGHRGVHQWLADLNHTYRREPALYEADCAPRGFEWLDGGDRDNSVISFIRWTEGRREAIAVVLNFTPVPRLGYRLGVPAPGFWRELLNSDAEHYGGSGHGNFGGVTAEALPANGRPYSVGLTLPPLGALFLKWEG